jgi:type II secretory pathway pseudopilin PulG
MNGARKARGFSLVELLVAFALFLMASIAIYSMLSVGIRATSQSGNTTQAVNFGRHILELIRARNLAFTQEQIPPSSKSGLNDQLRDRIPLNASPFGESDFSGLSNTTQFTRNISISRLSSNRNSFEYNLMKIEVAVYWKEKNQERGVEVSALHRQP